MYDACEIEASNRTKYILRVSVVVAVSSSSSQIKSFPPLSYNRLIKCPAVIGWINVYCPRPAM